jgi:hypothetical protein
MLAGTPFPGANLSMEKIQLKCRTGRLKDIQLPHDDRDQGRSLYSILANSLAATQAASNAYRRLPCCKPASLAFCCRLALCCLVSITSFGSTFTLPTYAQSRC